jgi:hypothetical protein
MTAMNEVSIFSENKELFYSYDGEGRFSTRLMAHGESGIFLQQMWDTFDDRRQKAREDVIAGKRSPICYHMERIRLDVLTLALIAGFTPFTVKRHFKPRVFKRLSPVVKAKYAEIFDISVEQLEHINLD